MNQPGVGDRPQSGVGLAVTAAVGPQPGGLARGRLDRAGATQRGEGGLAGQPVRIVAGGDEQLGGSVHADAVAIQEPGRDPGDQPSDLPVELADLGVQGEPAAPEGAQGELGGAGSAEPDAATGQVLLAQWS